MLLFEEFIKIVSQGTTDWCEDAIQIRPILLSAIKDTHLFYIHTSFLKESHLQDILNPSNNIATPFKTCWLQFSRSFFIENEYFCSNSDKLEVCGLFLHEKGPYEYMAALLVKHENIFQLMFNNFDSRFQNADAQQDGGVISTFLFPFAAGIKSTNGQIKLNERVKYKANGEKKIHKIKNVVLMLPYKASNQEKNKLETEFQRKIDWSHRWFVRGHWRKCKTIGKDREGQYCVQGFTYVTEHQKGKMDVEPIKKNYVVLNEESSQLS